MLFSTLLPNETITTSCVLQRPSVRGVASKIASSLKRSAGRSWLVLGWVALFLASSFVEAEAGCQIGGEDWYRNYHHGYHGSEVVNRVDGTSKHSSDAIIIYEDGQFREIANPLPPQCQGPQCRNTPVQEFGNLATIQQQQTVSFAVRTSQCELLSPPVISDDSSALSHGAVLAGFPAVLDEPPRSIA